MMDRNLTSDEQREQGIRCGCRGSDDYCPCQNVPDRVTRKAWGLDSARHDLGMTTLAGPKNPSIPYAMFWLKDLLQQIASGRDPMTDMADSLVLLDYWRRDAKRILPAIVEPSQLDEDFHQLLTLARESANTLRAVRQEYRSPSANFSTMVPVPYAQDAAAMIERLVSAIEARAASTGRVE